MKPINFLNYINQLLYKQICWFLQMVYSKYKSYFVALKWYGGLINPNYGY